MLPLLSSPHAKGVSYAIVSGLCFGMIGYLGMNLIRVGLSVPEMLFWRFFLSSIILGLYTLTQPTQWSNVPIKDSFFMFMYGALLYSISSLSYFLASTHLGTGVSMVIFFTYPAMVVLCNGWFLKMAIPAKDYGACILLSVGLLLLLEVHAFHFHVGGMIFAFLNPIAYVGYIILSRHNSLPPTFATFVLMLGCSATCFISSWIFDGHLTIPSGTSQWIDLAVFAMICTTLPMLFFRQSLQYISTDKASMLSAVEPVFVVLLGVIYLDEYLSITQIVGVSIVVIAAFLTLMTSREAS